MRFAAVCLVLVLLLATAGCSTAPAQDTFALDGGGRLAIAPGPSSAPNATVLNATPDATLTRLVFPAPDGVPVTAYVAAPPHPRAAVVYVPGANEPVSGHTSRFADYPAAGIAFLYLDVRGNGFETPGRPLDLNEDYAALRQDRWPQSYRVVADAMRARAWLADAYAVPVWAVGSSNGGRYAAIAAGVDPAFAGYAGVSTSGLGAARPGNRQTAERFERSVDPATYIGSISPRPVVLYHSRADPVVPFAGGQALYAGANEPRAFVTFNGTHGINPEVDRDLIDRLTQIYGS